MFESLGLPFRAAWRRKATLALAGVLVGAAGVVVVHAGVIGGGGFFPFPGGPFPTVIACAHNGNGDLRAVATASDCGTNEHVVTFAGPQAPQSVTVDCSAGQSLNNAIASAVLNLPLTVTIKGTCVENVTINRDWVAVQPASPGDGIRGSLWLIDAQHVYLSGLTLTGNSVSVLWAQSGSSYEADHITVNGAGGYCGLDFGEGSVGFLQQPTLQSCGIHVREDSSATVVGGTISRSGDSGVVVDGAQATLSSVTITTSKDGVDAVGGGSAVLNNDTIELNGGGVTASNGGTISLSGGTIDYNGGGVGADAGVVSLSGSVQISNNGGDGVALVDGGRVIFRNDSQVKIQNNNGNGVVIQDISVANFARGNPTPGQITGNSGSGIFCESSPAVAMTTGDPSAWTISGNGAPVQNNCPNA